MTIRNVFEMGLVKDKTEIIIRDGGFKVFRGDQYHPDFLEYKECKIDGFTYHHVGDWIRFDLL